MNPKTVVKTDFKALFKPAVIVAALGYFVDIYDLLLFTIVRKPSLESLGLQGSLITTNGVFLTNMQMIGMLFGGILWGILGDKKGRLSVLFGSIALYSIANIANAFVHDVNHYAICRFLAGLGLAGELGAGITLVSEVLPSHLRGFGTMVVATIGVSGAIVAGVIGEFFSWRTNYIVGGVLGLSLLLLRIGVSESGMFEEIHSKTSVVRGKFFSLFSSKNQRRKRYLSCIFSGIPIWFVIGILMGLSPELGRAFEMQNVISSGRAIVFCYSGLVFGDFFSGFLSQHFKTRLGVLRAFIIGGAATMIAFYLFNPHASQWTFYTLCFILGFFSGYWAVFVTIAAEQFGTNMRSTVATSVPNFVRSSVVPMNLALVAMQSHIGILSASAVIAAVAVAVSLFSSFQLKDTYGTELDFIEM